MRSPRSALVALAAAAAATAPGSAHAYVPHVVAQGETLWSIAAANNFTTRSVAAFNGLTPEAQVILGSTLRVPTVAEAAAALSGTPAAAPPAAAGAPAPEPMGAYTVRPGDSLSALAARSRVPMEQMAQMNGLDPAEPLLAGTVIKLPTGSPVTVSGPVSGARIVPDANPRATPGRVTPTDIAAVATRNGVPASLATAVAWQESGFNNALVSAANARGVMQILPGTWDWVQATLARRQLDPASPIDNVASGVLYLGELLRETGGDHALAAAGYYQGLASVRRIGLLPETQRYVANVLALRARFGG